MSGDVVPIDPEWACPHCNGRLTYASLSPGPVNQSHTRQVPCRFCNETGDRRNAPTEWKRCPTNRYRTEM